MKTLKHSLTLTWADDTNLGGYDKHLDTLINRFVKKLKVLLEWCDFNKLDINWSKTYFMFVTNKRIKPPKEIIIDTKIVNNKTVDIKVSVVTSFKLLGVTLDNKLTFIEHCSNIKKIVNKKLYSINRLFFLCTSIKIHFFKTFIPLYFDYCLSLIPRVNIKSVIKDTTLGMWYKFYILKEFTDTRKKKYRILEKNKRK